MTLDPIITTIVCYTLFNAAVGAMNPPPTPHGAYAYFYRFLQLAAFNLDRYAAAKFGPRCPPPEQPANHAE